MPSEAASARQADDLRMLRAAYRSREAIFSIHYACQNLNDVASAPAAVSCISFCDLHTGAVQAFGFANVGTKDTSADEREKQILESAFKFMRDHSEARWLHWKMSRPEYGFQALADRLVWIGGTQPAVPPADRRHDLDSLISDRYGADYAPHPRLPNLIARNGLASRYARWGAEEPALVDRGDFTGVQQSASEKVRLLAEVFERMIDGRLQTTGSAGEVEFAGEYLDSIAVVLGVAERFELVRRNLLRRHGSRETLKISDEYDAQDLLRALLVQFFDDVRDEEYTPSYAGGASRIDFLLPQTRVAVELKWMRDSLTAATLGAELIVDRARYKPHPGVGHLVCVVFDYEGRLPNPRGLESDLTKTSDESDVPCTVKIVDR